MEFGQVLLLILLFLTAVFLIVLVLIQRGKGGGLAGALGGMGGQSAFGTKAGDLFTKITIGVAFFWIILCLASGKLLAPPKSRLENELTNAATEQKEQTPPTTGQAPEKTPALTEKAPAPSEKAPASTPAPSK